MDGRKFYAIVFAAMVVMGLLIWGGIAVWHALDHAFD